MKRVVIIGAGGHARDTAWHAREVNRRTPTFDVLGFVVSDLTRLGPHDSPVLGDETWIDEHRQEIHGLVLGIGSPRARAQVAARLQERFPELEWPTIVHPSALLDWNTLQIGRGVLVGAGVIGTVNVRIEDFAVLNPTVTLGHEAVVGTCSVMNHAAGLSGGTVLEREVLVGTGARVLQYRRVGAQAQVGAGAVVTKDVPAGETWVGIPARRLER